MTVYQPGDMCLVASPTLVGAAIRLGTRSRFNHVRLVITATGGTVEAQPEGAVRGRVRAGDLVVRPPLTSEQQARIPAVGASLTGIPYGFLDVAALGLAQFGVTLPSVTRRIERPDRLFCSQLYDYALFLAGVHLFDDGRVPQDVSPGDLGDLAFRTGWTRI